MRTSARQLASLAIAVGSLALPGCARDPRPEDVALAYGRAVYANDPAAIYALVSADDRRARDEATFRRQQATPRGFALEIVRHLASFVTATPLGTERTGDRATVTLRFRLPNANDPAIAKLMHDWDDQRLDALAPSERDEIRQALDQLHRTGRLPVIDGDETIELVREKAGWRVSLHWADGIRLRFGATTDQRLPLEVRVSPGEILVTPGERVRVTVRAKNIGSQNVTARVGHAVEPKAQADFLALLQCPLFVPVTLKPGEAEEFTSEYLVLKDIRGDVKQLTGTYEFRPVAPQSKVSSPAAASRS